MTLIKKSNLTKPVGFFPKISAFDDLFDNWSVMDWKGNFFDDEKWVPAANVKDAENELIVELSVPGYKKEDIHVEVDKNGMMIISGEHEEESKDESEKFMRKEFSSGSFYRSFKLPQSVKENEIVAKCKNGLLQVKLPKLDKTELKEAVREIEIV